MASRSRVFVLALSTVIMVLAFVGGYLGQAVAKDDTYQHLRVFEDVVSLVLNNYVEPVDVSQAMKGAMKGLADSLDPESAYLSPDLVRSLESNDPGGAAEVGVDLTRQYYLRVVAVRDGSVPGAGVPRRHGLAGAGLGHVAGPGDVDHFGPDGRRFPALRRPLPHPGEPRRQPVVVVLGPSLERVVVALGALHSYAEEELGGGFAE